MYIEMLYIEILIEIIAAESVDTAAKHEDIRLRSMTSIIRQAGLLCS